MATGKVEYWKKVFKNAVPSLAGWFTAFIFLLFTHKMSLSCLVFQGGLLVLWIGTAAWATWYKDRHV